MNKIPSITKTQKNKVFNDLSQNSAPEFGFFLMLILSAVIVTFGLLMENVAIIIGGMLIAPILWPALSLAMGIKVSDLKLIENSAKIILKASLLMIVISALISLVFLERSINPEIASRTTHFLSYFFVALVSGVAASYAFSSPRFSIVLPGVAISVALIPPLSVMGISISFLSWDILVNSMGVFFLNLLGIIFGSLMVFSILEFDEIKKEVKAKVKREDKKQQEEKEEKEKEKDVKEIKKTLKEVGEIIENNNKKSEKNE